MSLKRFRFFKLKMIWHVNIQIIKVKYLHVEIFDNMFLKTYITRYQNIMLKF